MWCLVHTCTHWTCFFNLIDYDIDLTELMFWKWSLLLLHCWPIEYLRMSWQWGWSAIMAASSPCSAARKPRSPLTLCQFAQILIDWTGSAILGHFVKAVTFIGIQQAGMQSGDRAYFVVLIESRSPSLKAALNRREASGESITITCPLVILFHSTSPNLTARHELFTTLSVQYTQAPLTDCS